METIVFVIVLAVALLVALPIAAMVMANLALRQNRELRERVERLGASLVALDKNARASGSPATSPSSAAPTPDSSAPESLDRPQLVPFDPDWAKPITPIKRPEVPTPTSTPPPPLPVHEPAPLPQLAPQPVVSAASPAPEPRPLRAATEPPRRAITPPQAEPEFSLERFMGVKLFGWLGGLALFFGVIFFVKYAFERDLIPPAVRVALGYFAGAGLLAGGLLVHRRNAYQILAQIFCATGVVILYGVTYAAYGFYRFPAFGAPTTFAIMALITAAAFLVALRLDALVVAVLGMLGGFLTPVLLPAVQDNLLPLSGYISLLDVGLIGLAAIKRGRWPLLAVGAAIGTALMQWGWFARFFSAARYYEGSDTFLPLGMLAGFAALFIAGALRSRARKESGPEPDIAALIVMGAAFAFAFYFLTFPAMTARPYMLYGFVLVLNLGALVLARGRSALAAVPPSIALLTFVHIAAWMLLRLRAGLLTESLVITLAFGALHALWSVLGNRTGAASADASSRTAAGPWIPVLALGLLLMAAGLSPGAPWVFWVAVLGANLLVLIPAAAAGFVPAVIAALLLTLAIAARWLFGAPPADSSALFPTLGIALATAGFFSAASGWLTRRGTVAPGGSSLLPSLSAALPFGLLILTILQLPVADPSPVFGAGLVLALLLTGIALVRGPAGLVLAALVCVLGMEGVWHVVRFQPSQPLVALGWYLGFHALFLAIPFVLGARCRDHGAPWVAAALSGVGHFALVHNLIGRAYPNDRMGLVPLAFAVPTLLALFAVLKAAPSPGPVRRTQLAWLGGVALLFITLIFPIQFDRQWLTVSWALEGAALMWLFRRVPHPGLKGLALVLLGTAFVRLALNPAVLSAYPRGGTAILNWHLYAYGLAAASLFAAGRWLPEGDRRQSGIDIRGVLYGLGGVLLFILLNIEIADFFTEPGRRFITLSFGGNFARDMTYSIAWGLFALGLLGLGIHWRAKGARYAAIGLLAVTLLKLFLHDLAALDSIFRIGALVGVAVIAFVASFLYQRFFALGEKP